MFKERNTEQLYCVRSTSAAGMHREEERCSERDIVPYERLVPPPRVSIATGSSTPLTLPSSSQALHRSSALPLLVTGRPVVILEDCLLATVLGRGTEQQQSCPPLVMLSPRHPPCPPGRAITHFPDEHDSSSDHVAPDILCDRESLPPSPAQDMIPMYTSANKPLQDTCCPHTHLQAPAASLPAQCGLQMAGAQCVALPGDTVHDTQHTTCEPLIEELSPSNLQTVPESPQADTEVPEGDSDACSVHDMAAETDTGSVDGDSKTVGTLPSNVSICLPAHVHQEDSIFHSKETEVELEVDPGVELMVGEKVITAWTQSIVAMSSLPQEKSSRIEPACSQLPILPSLTQCEERENLLEESDEEIEMPEHTVTTSTPTCLPPSPSQPPPPPSPPPLPAMFHLQRKKAGAMSEVRGSGESSHQPPLALSTDSLPSTEVPDQQQPPQKKARLSSDDADGDSVDDDSVDGDPALREEVEETATCSTALKVIARCRSAGMNDASELVGVKEPVEGADDGGSTRDQAVPTECAREHVLVDHPPCHQQAAGNEDGGGREDDDPHAAGQVWEQSLPEEPESGGQGSGPPDHHLHLTELCELSPEQQVVPGVAEEAELSVSSLYGQQAPFTKLPSYHGGDDDLGSLTVEDMTPNARWRTVSRDGLPHFCYYGAGWTHPHTHSILGRTRKLCTNMHAVYGDMFCTSAVPEHPTTVPLNLSRPRLRLGLSKRQRPQPLHRHDNSLPNKVK